MTPLLRFLTTITLCAFSGAQQSCTYDADCISGACGREEAFDTARTVCCDGGRKEKGTTISDLMNNVYYCADLGAGAYCGGNDMLCASGKCNVFKKCLGAAEEEEMVLVMEEEDKDEEGKSCRQGYQCSSGICDTENGCSSTKLPDGSRCSGSSDSDNCISGECAKKPGDTSKYICCYDGETKKDTSFSDLMGKVYYFTGKVMEEVMEEEEKGKLCIVGYECSSGICDVENGCSSAKLPDGSQCSSSEDSDNCISGKCARAESGVSKNVCCDDGESMYVSIRNTVCKNLPVGSKCSGKNELCASGRCGFDGYCANADGTDSSQGSVPMTGNDDKGSSGIDYSLDPPKALDGTVLCDDGMAQGYASLSKLNFEANKYRVDNSSKRTFVLCPGTYDLSSGNYQARTHQITLRNGQTVQCGDDGVSTVESGNARCIISGDWGQTEQVSVAGDSTNIIVKGLTFEATSSKSLDTNENKNGQNTVSFVDCRWNFGGSSRTSFRSHLSVSMAVSFHQCTFKGNTPNENVIAISYPGNVSINESVFLFNQPSKSIIHAETGSDLSILPNHALLRTVLVMGRL